MPLNYPLKSYLYHFGLKSGLPFAFLRRIADAYDASRGPRNYLTRRRIAADLLSRSEWRDFLPRGSGARRFGPNEIPGLARLVDIGREIYELRGGDDIVRPDGNPFATLLEKSDFAAHPEILEIALSRPIVEIMCGYFGTVPRLDCIDLWVTPPDDQGGEAFGSQLFHLDKPEQQYVSLFLNVFDVQTENGPFTYLPGDRTAAVRRATHYEKLYYLGNGRLPDEKLFKFVAPDDIVPLTGPTGAGGIVDTSACLHLGSRNRSRARVVFVMSFMPAHKGGTPGFRNFDIPRRKRDNLTELLLQPPQDRA